MAEVGEGESWSDSWTCKRIGMKVLPRPMSPTTLAQTKESRACTEPDTWATGLTSHMDEWTNMSTNEL